METKFDEKHLMLCLDDYELAHSIRALTHAVDTVQPVEAQAILRKLRDTLEDGRTKLPSGRFVLLGKSAVYDDTRHTP